MLDVGDFSAGIAGPLLGIGQQQAAGLVDQFADAQLLDLAAMDATGTARYRFHDLVRIYARERATAEDLPGARRMALARVTAGWLALAEQADARLPGVSDVITTGSAARWLLPTDLVDRSLADPLAWFELERTNLVAAVEAASANGLEEPPGNRDLPGPGRLAWRGQSPSCLGRGLEADRDLSGAGAGAPGCHRVRDPSLHLARMIGDTNIEADALLTLGSGYRYLGQPAEATPALEEAWQLALLLDLRHGQAFMMWHLAMLARDSGRPHAAGALLQQSLQLVRKLQDRRGQAQLLLDLGQVRADEGRLELADALLAAALAAWPTHTENHGFRARTLDGLGRLRCRQQRYDDAVDHFAEAASQYGELSAHAARARSLEALGDALVAAGRPQQARAARQQALVLQRRAGTPDENW
jgi:tetratricopeptide (TPR) repeat protein